MANTLRSKTLTSSLAADPSTAFSWIADSQNLSGWYNSALRSATTIQFIRDDRARLLDLILVLDTGELPIAIRVLPNGDGSEVVLTLIQPRGLSDAEFHDYTRRAESALSELKKIHSTPTPAAKATEGLSAPLQDEEPGPAGQSIESDAGISQAPVSGRKLFVGNLPFAWSDEQLWALFAGHGTVSSVRIARLRGRGGRSRGFGFVEMSSEAEAQTAIEKLHDGLAGERKIIVRLAKTQESRPESAPGEAAASPRTQSGSGRPERGGPASRSQARPPRPGRAPRPNRPPSASRPQGRNAPRPDRPRKETGISNNSGYEIYPRDSKGVVSSEPTSRSAAGPTEVEASPYFDDTGDVENRENRGNRNPRHRRR